MQQAAFDERQHPTGMGAAVGGPHGFDAIAVDRSPRGCHERENLRRRQAFEYLVLTFEHLRRFRGVGDFQNVPGALFADQEVQVALAVEPVNRPVERKQPPCDRGRLLIRKFRQITVIRHRL